uniref:Putative secreted protein n=1 Tax=Anopheles darlingi TaxID=43151 RepID=A0A2M4DA36_ANODA
MTGMLEFGRLVVVAAAACFFGISFGKSPVSMAKKSIAIPSSIQPNHQAPSQRGSELSMIGVLVGSM